MRTIILMTGFIVTLCFNLNAQSFVFNKIYHFGPEADHEKAQSIIETEKGFIIAGDVDSYIIPYTGNKLLLYEIDKEGNLIWSRQFYNADYDRFSSGCNLFRVNDSLYDWFVVQSEISQQYIRRPLLIRFNSTGQVLFTKVLYDAALSDSASLTPLKAYKTRDNGYLLVCDVFPFARRLMKFREDLSMEWMKDISSNNDFINVSSIIELENGDFFLSYSRSNNNARMTRFARLSAAGTITWSTTVFNYDNTRMIYELALLEDSTLLSIGTQGGKLQASKFTMEGQILWSKTLGDVLYYPRVYGLFRQSDGSFKFFGSAGLDNEGFIFKITADADSIYYRPGIMYRGPGAHMAFVNNGILTPDENIVFCGSIVMEDPENDWPDRAWVVKTDLYGCDVPGCDSTGVTIMDATNSQINCKGGQNFIGVNALGLNLQYQWQILQDSLWISLENNDIYSNCQSDTLRINNTIINDGEELYRCIVWNEWYAQFTREICINYISTPEIIQHPQSQFVEEDSQALLSIVATSGEEQEVQWFFNGTALIGCNTTTLEIFPVTPADTGVYQCRIWNYCGEKLSLPAYVKIIPNSLEESTGLLKMMIVPNPIKDEFRILNSTGRTLVEIFDLTGRLVHTAVSANGYFYLPVDILTGIYLFRTITQNGVFFNKVKVID